MEIGGLSSEEFDKLWPADVHVIGKDIYILAYTTNGLVPAGFSETNETVKQNCSKNATGQNAGYYCINLVKANGWEIPDELWSLK